MRLVSHSDIPADACLAGTWNELVHQMECPEVFYTHEWALAVSRAYRAVITPLLLLAYEGDVLIGVAAFATANAGNSASFLAGFTADYCDFVSHPGLRAEFVKTVLAELRNSGIHTVVLANLPGHSVTHSALTGRASNFGYSFFSKPAYQCAQVLLRSTEERDYTRHSIQRKQMVRRHLKGMSKIGSVTLRHAESWQEIEPLIPTFSKAHVARFLENGKISNLAHPERQLFLNELARLLSARGWVRMTSLMVGKREAAWNYGFLFAGNWFWYQPTFDGNFRRYYPGYCLLAKIVEEACDDPKLDRVDMGLGDEPYKNKFRTALSQTFDVTITSSSLRYVKDSLRYRITSAIRRVPGLENHIRKFMGRISTRTRRPGKDLRQYLRSFYRSMRHRLFSQQEVLFFEWSGGGAPGIKPLQAVSSKLQFIDLELLATAAMNYEDDENTLTYLLRAAARLRSQARGLALLTNAGVPVHFCWLHNGEETCELEWEHYVKGLAPNAVLLQDNWTPSGARNHNIYDQALPCVASHLHAEGKAPWIYSLATDVAFVRKLTEAGFTQVFSLKQRNLLFTRKITDSPRARPRAAVKMDSAA